MEKYHIYINYVFGICPKIKVDTSEDNIRVQKILEYNNFICCAKLKPSKCRDKITWLVYQKIE